MPHRNDYDDEEEFSGSEDDDGFDEDFQALRRACMIVGADPNDLDQTDHELPAPPPATSTWSSDSEDDIEIVRNIKNRLALSNDVCEPLSFDALSILRPVVSDDEEDDFETLRAIQKRFSAYNSADTQKSSVEDLLETPKLIHESTSDTSEDNNSNNLFENKIVPCEDACNGTITNVSQPSASADAEWHQSDEFRLSVLPQKQSNFPKSAQVFIDAIKKNRSYQKYIRSKLTQIESRIEENSKLKERVKILKDFQVSCRKITGRALAQKKDLRVQLISARKSRNLKDSEGTDKKLSAINYGPEENSQVSDFKMALTKSPLSLHRKKWSKKENENLGKGIRQQFQEMVLHLSVDRFSVVEGSATGTNSLDSILASIKDIEVTPELVREFLPKVNWDQLASMYVEGRSGAECEVRWLNYEDPSINHNPWTADEDKSFLLIIQEKGITDWSDIALSLGTNRTPFQCLARYQRSLNACILKREWTKEEDEQLQIAVEAFGESNWQFVASTLKGRTGPQCSNRWKKTLHPSRERQGRWNPDEDKRLTVATLLFGPRNWKKIAQFVPGRTQVQCRERWVNSLDPSVKRSKWTEQEDLKLEEAIKEHGYCWSKVATALPSRTDNQCWRRWKALHPGEVPLFLQAKKMQKAALISNFVDREEERPALNLNDFIPMAMLESASQTEGVNSSKKRKRKSSNTQMMNKSHGDRRDTEVSSEEVLAVIETSNQHDTFQKKKTVKPRLRKKKAVSGPESMREPMSNSFKDVLHDDDITLASLRSKLKMQKPSKMQNEALISNFVDREQERPALNPNDFIPITTLESALQPEELNSFKKRKRKPRNSQIMIESHGDRRETQVSSEEVMVITDSAVIEASNQHDPIQKKKTVKPKKKAGSELESVREPLSNSVKDVVHDDEITLACLLSKTKEEKTDS